jgi:ferrochelatase
VNCLKNLDAFLLISYGAPYIEADVVPFLERLLGGKNISQTHREKATIKYYDFAKRNGKFSPLNEQCQELLLGIELEFDKIGSPTRVYLGNLYWRPFIEDVIAKMADDGVSFAKCFITSAFDSTAGNRRYSYAIEEARKKIGDKAPVIERLPLPFDQPLFIESQAEKLCDEIIRQKNNNNKYKPETSIFFTAHSIPKSDPFVENYVEQLNFACRAVMEKCCSICQDLCGVKWELLFQSQPINSGNHNQNSQWLEPTIKDKITTLVQQTTEKEINVAKNIIISPIGFFCESMETVNDLDFELGDICKNSQVKFARVFTVGTMPKIYKMIVQLVNENR